MHEYDIRELRDRAVIFEKRIEHAKTELAPHQIPWYPYRTLMVYGILDKLLSGPRRRLLDLVSGDPILDIGCADGANSFFLETLGCQVVAVDSAHTNQNQLRGFEALKGALQSSVALRSIDLDTQFSLPDDVFGLAFFLGVLYHLKNPYYILEALASRVRYCLLSTRIAKRTPRGNPMADEALVYLLDPDECNHDYTNHWIFSEAALRRLLHQTGWNVHDFMTAGDTRKSEPARIDRDERAFCLLESRVCQRYSVKLLEGWHDLEQNSFRWTKKHFSIEMRHLPSAGSTLRFDFRTTIPGPVTLAANVNGMPVPPSTFSAEGEHSYTIPISACPRPFLPVQVDFTADQSFRAANDERELAILVPFWKEGRDGADPNLPFQLS
jgi:2-polyprenyl-3-methyl-5-hydroxy-6-metoxy-1,4-benzoquinol methylase